MALDRGPLAQFEDAHGAVLTVVAALQLQLAAARGSLASANSSGPLRLPLRAGRPQDEKLAGADRTAGSSCAVRSAPRVPKPHLGKQHEVL